MLFNSDKERFDKIYTEYHRMVRNVTYNLTGGAAVDDLVQESFLKIWKGLPRFGSRSSVKTWVYRITVNVAIDYLRRTPVLGTLIPWEETRDHREAYTKPEQQEAIQMALAKLDAEHRTTIVLHYFEDLSLEEVAGVLDVPVGTVKSRLHNGRHKLEECLKERIRE